MVQLATTRPRTDSALAAHGTRLLLFAAPLSDNYFVPDYGLCTVQTHMTPRKRAPSQTCDRLSASEVMNLLFTAFLGEHTSALRTTRGERVCTWRPVTRLTSYGRLVLIACAVTPNESRHRKNVSLCEYYSMCEWGQSPGVVGLEILRPGQRRSSPQSLEKHRKWEWSLRAQS